MEICWQIQANQQWTNTFQQGWKRRNEHRNLILFGPEKTDFLKILKKILRFFVQHLLGKLTFFVKFQEMSSLIFAFATKVLPLEDNTWFQQQFPVSGGGSTCSPSLRHWYLNDCYGSFILQPIIYQTNIPLSLRQMSPKAASFIDFFIERIFLSLFRKGQTIIFHYSVLSVEETFWYPVKVKITSKT